MMHQKITHRSDTAEVAVCQYKRIAFKFLQNTNGKLDSNKVFDNNEEVKEE